MRVFLLGEAPNVIPTFTLTLPESTEKRAHDALYTTLFLALRVAKLHAISLAAALVILSR